MDSCFVDVTVEFLAVAFHNILYYAAVYPKNIFETRKKYCIVVYRSIHPDVNDYIELCLKTITELLRGGQLSRIELAITDKEYKPTMKFVFDINQCENYNPTTDAYLVQAEQNLRAFCLLLSNMCSKFNTPDDASFSIYLHTTEASAVVIAANPDLENFPLVQVEEKFVESDRILPIRRFIVKDYSFDTYIELKHDQR